MSLKVSGGMTASSLLSISLHALLLFLAGLLVVAPTALDRQLIRISLLQPGGGNGNGPEAGLESPAPADPPRSAERPVPKIARAPVEPPDTRARKPLPLKPPPSQRVAPESRASEVTADSAGAGVGPDTAGKSGTGGSGGEGKGGGKGLGRGGGTGTGNGLQAHCLYCPKPDYPRVARLRGWEGTADVEVLVARDGSVRDAQIHRSSGHAVLDDAAVSVALESRFKLPDANREPVRGLIAYGFRLRQ